MFKSDNFILFRDLKEVLWDNLYFGPPLTNGGYRVTKELIESVEILILEQ